MHELSLIRQVVKTVLLSAERSSAGEVTAVTLIIGKARMFLPEWVQLYFNMFAKGTVAEGARVILEEVPVTASCHECGEIFVIDPHEKNPRCPKCAAERYKLLTGRELIVKNIEIREPGGTAVSGAGAV